MRLGGIRGGKVIFPGANGAPVTMGVHAPSTTSKRADWRGWVYVALLSAHVLAVFLGGSCR